MLMRKYGLAWDFPFGCAFLYLSYIVIKIDGNIAVKNSKFTSIRKKHKILDLPIVRGCVNFVEMMKLS